MFFVPAHVDAVDIHHELTTRLARCLSDSAEVRVATSSDRNASTFLQDCDLLHIFGCWSNSACQLGDKAYALRLPYIITPLGLLQPWEMEKHRYRSVFLRKQKNVVEKAAAISVCGKLEEQTFTKLGWNPRVSLVKNPVLTSQTNFDEVAECFLHLYRKVLDSNVRLRFDARVRRLIGRLLQLGIDKQCFDYGNAEKSLRDELHGMTDEDWRKIFIYADEEDVDEPIKRALGSLQYEYPQVDVASIDRFDTRRTYAAGSLKDDVLLSRNIILRNKVKETFATRGKTEQRVCLQILNLQYELGRRTAPLHHLVDLYLTMRFTDMDEDTVKDMAKELGVDEFAQSLMAVMAEWLGLAEGFMPFSPKSGRKAKSLLEAITKFGQYKT